MMSTQNKNVTYFRKILATIMWAMGFFICVCHSGMAAGCDPEDALNDKARNYRITGRLPDARKAVAQVLAIRSNDFRARYTSALIDLDESKVNKSNWAKGMAGLIAVSKDVDIEGSSCAKQKNYYSIFNTIGAEYFDVRDYRQASIYFFLAAQHMNDLDVDTRNKLYDNLGLVRFVSHDYVCAAADFKKAASAGLRNGAAHLALANQILSAASDQRICTSPY